MTSEDSGPLIQTERTLLTRREAVLTVIGYILGATTDYYIQRAMPRLEKGVRRLFLEHSERRQRVLRLFFPSGSFDVVPARDHPIETPLGPSQRTYRNEEDAVAAIEDLGRLPHEIVSEPYEVHPDHSIVCIGSSVSNLRSQELLGNPWADSPLFDPIVGRIHVPLTYSIIKTDVTTSRFQNGETRLVPNYEVIDRDSRPVAIPRFEPSTTQLISDVLLVTKAPRILGGTSWVIFAGLHGPAIRAVRLLIDAVDIADLDYLENEIGGSDYFQAVFRVEELVRAGDTTVPSIIRIDRSDSARPRPIRPRRLTR